MTKLISTIIILGFFLFIFEGTAKASLILIDKNGNLTWNVLSEQDVLNLETPTYSSLELKKIANENTDNASSVSLKKTSGGITLTVDGENSKKEMNISDFSEEIVEIEERPEMRRIRIYSDGGNFVISQSGIKAKTEFSLTVDVKTANLYLSTMSGNKYLSIMPYDAVVNLLRVKLISNIPEKTVEIVEKDRELQYKVEGQKTFNLFDMFKYNLPLAAYVSASTGEVLDVEAPGWFKVIRLFFV